MIAVEQWHASVNLQHRKILLMYVISRDFIINIHPAH
jgi:hypothetical protein